MNIQTRIDKLLGERCDSFIHSSGLEVCVIPKKHTTLCAKISTRYGSVDSTFRRKDGELITVPDGIAHFLEHKLFEQEDGSDAFMQFAALGGDSNAGTDFDVTSYYFTATENYEENITVLLDFVTHPFFNKNSVQKEQGIIGQEIRMYDDDPNWRVFFGLMQAMYKNNPMRNDIAGTVESISHITPELLYECYNTFYDLSNMLLCVCGDITTEKVAAICDKVLGQKKTDGTFSRSYPDEPREVFKKRASVHLEVAQPLFAIGFKDVPGCGEDIVRRDFINSILLRAIFGQSGDFYTKHYKSGLITKRFGASYSFLRTGAFASIEGSSKDPESVYAAVMEEIALRKRAFISETDFVRAKKTVYSSFIQTFDSTDETAGALTSYMLAGVHLFDIPKIISSISYADAKECFDLLYCEQYSALSVVNPIRKDRQ